MRVLVTGASGFIGRALVPRLLAEGWHVRAHARAQTSALPQVGERMEAAYGELPSQTLSESLCEGMDVIIHLAGLAHVASSESDLRRHNLIATLELVRAARAKGVRKFIFVSSTKANYPAHSAYGRVKAQTEEALLTFHEPEGFQVLCLRPALVYGAGMRGNLRSLLKLLKRQFLPVFIYSDQRIGMISVQDLARAIVLAIAHDDLGGRCLELHDGHRYTLNEISTTVRRHLGHSEPWLRLPRALVKTLAVLSETIAPFYNTSFSLGTYRTIFEENHAADETFFELTRFTPEDSFQSALPALLRSAQD